MIINMFLKTNKLIASVLHNLPKAVEPFKVSMKSVNLRLHV